MIFGHKLLMKQLLISYTYYNSNIIIKKYYQLGLLPTYSHLFDNNSMLRNQLN